MAHTAQELITDAIAHSSANRPDVLATQATELVGQLNVELGRMFALARDIDPTYTGAVTTVGFTGDGWPFPGNCYTVTRIEATGDNNPLSSSFLLMENGDNIMLERSTERLLADGAEPPIPNGTEILIVPFDDRTLETGSPAVYEYGQTFYCAGNLGDPRSGTLRLFFARTPNQATGLTSLVDSPWPEEFDHVVVLGLAAYLARKDNRSEEAAAFEQERDQIVAQFRQHVRLRVASTRQRFGMFRPQQVDADPEN